MKGRVSLLLLLALALTSVAACGGGEERRGAATDEPTGPGATEATTAPGPSATSPVTDTGVETVDETTAEREYEIWGLDGRFVRPEWQLGSGGQAVARTALDLLLAHSESAIPPGTDLRAVHVTGPAAHVDLSAQLGTRPSRLALAQIVYTVTQFENVRSVLLTVEGEPLSAHPEPLTRDDLEDVVAPVVVLEPTGTEPVVTSPIRVSGTANTFEANVTIRVLGANREELASTFTTATCGTGCRGDFVTTVNVDVASETRATLVVAEDDPSGGEGRPPYAIEIPLVLRP